MLAIWLIPIAIVGATVNLAVGPGYFVGWVVNVMAFLWLFTGLLLLPLVLMERRRTRSTRIVIDQEGWSIETDGPYGKPERLAGELSNPPVIGSEPMSSMEASLITWGLQLRNGLVARDQHGNEITFGSGMLLIERDAVAALLHTLMPRSLEGRPAQKQLEAE